jgi:hypothetical protein
MTSIFTGVGYRISDNRASGGKKVECDILTCTHCQAVLDATSMKNGAGENGWCRRCNAPICGLCADKMLTGGCLPYIKQVEMAVDAQYRRAQLMKIAGLQEQPQSGFRRSGHT